MLPKARAKKIHTGSKNSLLIKVLKNAIDLSHFYVKTFLVSRYNFYHAMDKFLQHFEKYEP